MGRAQAAAAGTLPQELLQACSEDYIEHLNGQFLHSEPGPARPQPGGRCHHPMRCWRPSHAAAITQVMAWGSYTSSTTTCLRACGSVSLDLPSSVPMCQEHYRLASLALPLPGT